MNSSQHSRRRRALAFVAGLALATTISAVAPAAASAQTASKATTVSTTQSKHVGAGAPAKPLLDWQW